MHPRSSGDRKFLYKLKSSIACYYHLHKGGCFLFGVGIGDLFLVTFIDKFYHVIGNLVQQTCFEHLLSIKHCARCQWYKTKENTMRWVDAISDVISSEIRFKSFWCFKIRILPTNSQYEVLNICRTSCWNRLFYCAIGVCLGILSCDDTSTKC